MRDPRNPFRMRASEQIASETTFLRLFGAGVLEILPRGDVFDRPRVFRSAPGGGKTSLLRVFTPSSLLTLHANRSIDDYKELHARMKELGALDENGPQLLGAMLSCAKNYAAIDDLPGDDLRKKRLFFALLNCRIALAVLRGALVLGGVEYPSGLNRLQVAIDPDTAAQLDLPSEGTGEAIYEWARRIEVGIAQTLDSFDSSPLSAPGHEGLVSLQILRPEQIRLDGRPISQHVLVMFQLVMSRLYVGL